MATLECERCLLYKKRAIFSTTLLIGLNMKLKKKKIFAKQHVFLNKFLITKSCLIESNLHKNPMCGKCKINKLL